MAHSVPRVQKLFATQVGSLAVVWLSDSHGAARRCRISKTPLAPQLSRCDVDSLDCLPRPFIPSDQQTPPARVNAVIRSDAFRRPVSVRSLRAQFGGANRRLRELPGLTPQ